LGAVEVSEMLALDAMHGAAPQVWAVLTTRSTCPDPEVYRRARRQLLRAIRRRWPAAEYCAIVEFTTGYGPRSGGRRRPHWNLLLKGISTDAQEELEALIVSVWCWHVDAKPEAQFVGEVSEQGGLMRYLALHFLKESQRPPAGWKGHRVTRSRGYLRQAGWKARAEAKASLRLKRAIYRAEREGHEGGAALIVAEFALLKEEQLRWECVVLTIDQETGELRGCRPLNGRDTNLRPRLRTQRVELWEAIEAQAAELRSWRPDPLSSALGLTAPPRSAEAAYQGVSSTQSTAPSEAGLRPAPERLPGHSWATAGVVTVTRPPPRGRRGAYRGDDD